MLMISGEFIYVMIWIFGFILGIGLLYMIIREAVKDALRAIKKEERAEELKKK